MKFPQKFLLNLPHEIKAIIPNEKVVKQYLRRVQY